MIKEDTRKNNKPLVPAALSSVEHSTAEYSISLRHEVLQARGEDLSIKFFYAKMREAREKGFEILDIGSSVKVGDLELPDVSQAIACAHSESLDRGLYMEYSSSWGMVELRTAICDYFNKLGNITLDPIKETMVTRGIMDSYARVLRAFEWRGVIIPNWAPYYVRSKALLQRLPLFDVPLDLATGNLRLDVLDETFQVLGVNPKGFLLYITHPSFPVGTVMQDSFIEEELIPYCTKRGITIFSDSYISATSFTPQKLLPLLSYKGAKEVCVEALTVAKELGLPGARAGGIAGNEHLINGIRLLAATEIDIVPGPSQLLAAHALATVNANLVGSRIQRELYKEIIPRFKRMGWPHVMPSAGIDMVVEVPPAYIDIGVDDPSLLAAISLMRHYGVAMCPCGVFGAEGKNYLRLVLKQKEGEIPQALDRLLQRGFCWVKEAPTTEDIDYLNMELKRLDLTRL